MVIVTAHDVIRINVQHEAWITDVWPPAPCEVQQGSRSAVNAPELYLDQPESPCHITPEQAGKKKDEGFKTF